MSRRTSEANKAIAKAWENERQNILEGKGTREWTLEQQRDILNNGKAHDDNGLAFEGQHMKSVGKYPEHQGDPSNIQFLTKEEHLEAHLGSWRNPTNWYFDPTTNEIVDFGENPPIPCEIFKLKQPIVADIKERETIEDSKGNGERNKQRNGERTDSSVHSRQQETNASKSATITHKVIPNGAIRKARRAANKVCGFVYKHPIITVVGIVVADVVKDKVTAGNRSSSGKDYAYCPDDHLQSEGVEPYDRFSPSEHTVSGHSQLYHTKTGPKIIEKEPYRRGGKKDD